MAFHNTLLPLSNVNLELQTQKISHTMNELERMNELYKAAAPENDQKDLLINDPEVNEIPVNQYEIVNPDKTEIVKEGAGYRYE